MEDTNGVKSKKWEYHLLKTSHDTKVVFTYNVDPRGVSYVESDTYPIIGPDHFSMFLSATHIRNSGTKLTLQYLYEKDIKDIKTCSNNEIIHMCVHAMIGSSFLFFGCITFYSAQTLSKWQTWTLMSSQQLSNYPLTEIKKLRVTFELNRPQNNENVDNSVTFFTNTYEDSKLTDFKLTGEDGSSVDIHRVVLAYRSPVISRMLSGEWKESQENKLKIAGSNASMLEQFKRYLYLKQVPEDNLQFHLELACLYEIEDMKADTAEKMCSELTVENAPQTLAFARRLKLDAVVEIISDYLMDNADDFVAAVIDDSVVNLKYGEKPLGNALNSAGEPWYRTTVTHPNVYDTDNSMI